MSLQVILDLGLNVFGGQLLAESFVRRNLQGIEFRLGKVRIRMDRVEASTEASTGQPIESQGPEIRLVLQTLARGAEVTLFVIYDHPNDWPNHFVLRAWHVPLGSNPVAKPDPLCVCTATIEEARLFLPPGLARLPRMPGDDSKIAETWI